MKIFNEVDLKDLKYKTTLESLEKDNAALLLDNINLHERITKLESLVIVEEVK